MKRIRIKDTNRYVTLSDRDAAYVKSLGTVKMLNGRQPGIWNRGSLARIIAGRNRDLTGYIVVPLAGFDFRRRNLLVMKGCGGSILRSEGIYETRHGTFEARILSGYKVLWRGRYKSKGSAQRARRMTLRRLGFTICKKG